MTLANTSKARISVSIQIKAKAGQEKNLAEFLAAAGSIVRQTEPATLAWFAYQIDERTFCIYDVFDDENGVNAHFSGKAAAALKEKAGEFIEGGWEKGVVENIRKFTVLSSAY